ncbi:sensor histidine kinase [Bacillus norwichensis]|uniref:histidine kinase n=1 Tax=Bacillus norwichensis TaxID=2762217 RepID=A0ABR8VJX2_9BACI|nr:sensor histidine kinase [Bacillus norwichensis]MBD8004716.1 GAF domain-containing protein [Bacillus norwichensis]
MSDRLQMIERLVGVSSSKISYYTELKKTIEEMKKKNTQLEIINEVMRSFNIDMSMDDMLKNILEKLQQIFPLKRLSLAIFKSGQLILTNVYPSDYAHIDVGNPIQREGSLYWEVADSGKSSVYVVNTDNRKRYNEISAFEKLELCQVLVFPLFGKGRILGVLSLGSTCKKEYDGEDLSFLQQLSDQLAVCIENVRLYNEVLNSKKEWEQTFLAVADPIMLVDLNGNILRCNGFAYSFFQLQGKNVSYITLDDLLYGQQAEPYSPFQETRNTKEMAYREVILSDETICEVHTYPIMNEKEEMYGVIAYIKDVTEKRHFEAHMLQSGKLAALGEMAAGVAHELNNPLTAILGNTQLMMRKMNENEPSHVLLTDIFKCSKRCQDIIRNLLTFSRQDEYLFQTCSINEAVEQVLSLIGYQIRQSHIELEVNLDPKVPLIDGSIQQLEQIIINLLLNAKDALDDVDKTRKKIFLQTAANQEEVTISVIDNGTGIASGGLKEIFHPFYTTKEAVKGTGLGLSVSLGIAETHGGTIDVKSELGKGSEFTLRLPVKKDSM